MILALALLLFQDKTQTVEKYGYSFTYPETLTYGERDEGWHLKCYKPGEKVEFNANLNVMYEAVQQEIKDTKEYSDAVLKALKDKLGQIKISIEPTPVSVNGREFYKMLYSAERRDRTLLVLQYFHYDPTLKTAFVWTAMDLLKNDLSNIAKLEKVILTIKFQ